MGRDDIQMKDNDLRGMLELFARFLKWVATGIIVGAVVGLVGVFFHI